VTIAKFWSVRMIVAAASANGCARNILRMPSPDNVTDSSKLLLSRD